MNIKNKAPGTSRRGRPKGLHNKRTWFARDWADKCGVDPIEFLTKVLASDTIEVLKTDAAGKLILDAAGKPLRELAAVPLEVRMESARILASYMYPKLQSTQITGKDDGPVAIATLDVMQILKRPELARALQEVALMVGENEENKLQRSDPALLLTHPDYSR